MNSNSTSPTQNNLKRAASASGFPQLYVVDVQPNDVLLGRGSDVVKYSGNIEFRRLIHERKDEYVASVRHSQKDHIAREVLNVVVSKNGSFLRKVENPVEIKKLKIPESVMSAWVQVDEAIIVEKIKQAFRDSCKEGSSTEQNLRNVGKNNGIVNGSKAAGARNSKALQEDNKLPGVSREDFHANVDTRLGENLETTKSESSPLQQASLIDTTADSTALSAATEPTIQQNTPIYLSQHQNHDDQLVQHLLQNQRSQYIEQQLLVEQLAALGAYPSSAPQLDFSAIRMNNAVASLYDRVGDPRIANFNHQDAMHNVLRQQLQTAELQLQLSMSSDLSRQSMAAMEQQTRSQNIASLLRGHLGNSHGLTMSNRISSNIGPTGPNMARSFQGLHQLPTSSLFGGSVNQLSDVSSFLSDNRMLQANLYSHDRRSALDSAALNVLAQEILMRSAVTGDLGQSINNDDFTNESNTLTINPQRSEAATFGTSASVGGDSGNPTHSSVEQEERDQSDTPKMKRARRSDS
jgi:hypothetical protein